VKISPKLICLELAAGVARLVWSFSVAFSVLFFLAAVFEPASWPRFFSVLTVVVVSDGLYQIFKATKKCLRLEAEGAPTGLPPVDVEELSCVAMHAGRQVFLARAATVGLNPAAWVQSTIAVGRDADDDATRARERACRRPTGFLFFEACRAFNDLDRAEIAQKAEAFRTRFDTVLANHGVERVELERRRLISLLQANYESELAGDFSTSSAKAREMVLTLMAAGRTLETLLEKPWNCEIFNQVLGEGDDEPIWAYNRVTFLACAPAERQRQRINVNPRMPVRTSARMEARPFENVP